MRRAAASGAWLVLKTADSHAHQVINSWLYCTISVARIQRILSLRAIKRRAWLKWVRKANLMCKLQRRYRPAAAGTGTRPRSSPLPSTASRLWTTRYDTDYPHRHLYRASMLSSVAPWHSRVPVLDDGMPIASATVYPAHEYNSTCGVSTAGEMGTGTERMYDGKTLSRARIHAIAEISGSGMQRQTTLNQRPRQETHARRHALAALDDSGASTLLWRPVKGPSAITVAPRRLSRMNAFSYDSRS
ncbi:hypothetical protein HDV63DRAFT_406568 [Trichoderma sp. SZMC 28014]